MKHPQLAFSQLYQSALREHIAGKSRPDAKEIAKIGGSARDSALPMLEFAKLHENFLVMDLLPRCPLAKHAALIHKAGIFFATAVAATNIHDRDAARLGEAIESLSGRTVELAAANLQLVREIIRQRDIEAELRISQQSMQDSLEKSEALTNVGRHARANRVGVIIRREPKFLRMEVADDGRSFKAGQVQSRRGTKHVGLLGMRERVEMIGGAFEIESSPGHGTKIIARIPVTKATEKIWNEAAAVNS